MRFGPVDLKDAEGAILAHSVQVEKGRLRKGITLQTDHILQLEAAGIAQVTVAQLGSEDVHEDVAATRLAEALAPDPENAKLRLGNAGTGRVNIFADIAGVAQIDATKINALNEVDPMITVATVPEWQRMRPRGMVATVKIIAYGVPEAALAAACAKARDALRIRAPVFSGATLIQTTTRDEDGEKGHAAIADRLARLGVSLEPKTQVAHDVAPLAEALKAAKGEVLFILTGSATSDAHDTAPEAVRAAGGEVAHFGMPVDPGNLLFIGSLAGKPVIGLPGCARSPALNGADWVLERVLCGVPVTGADIMAMGVGGLLKEIPSRPQPRGG